jgi:hypothetical protein
MGAKSWWAGEAVASDSAIVFWSISYSLMLAGSTFAGTDSATILLPSSLSVKMISVRSWPGQ